MLRTTYGRHDGVCDEDLALRDDDLRGVDQRARLSDLQDLHARQSLLWTPADRGWARSRRLAVKSIEFQISACSLCFKFLVGHSRYSNFYPL